MNTLTVALDGSPLETPLTGIGQYTLNLANALSQQHEQLNLYLLFNEEWKQVPIVPRAIPDTQHSLARRIVQITDLMGWRTALLRKYLKRLKQQQLFARGVEQINPQLVHGPDYYLPETSLPTIVTVHDISCFRHPETHSRARVEWQRRTLPKTLARADHILTVSEFSKREIAEYFSVPQNKITVTPNGVSEFFYTGSDDPLLNETLRKFQLSANKFILTVGTLEPRKNLKTLIAAYAKLAPSTRSRLPLIVVGMHGWGENSLSRQAEKLKASGQLRFLGYVPQIALPYLYAGARVFAYPSIYEGFGMPIIEAMAAKTPVITSNCSSLPEVAGDAALCVAPLDEECWRQELERLINDKPLREQLSQRGSTRAMGYSWSNTAATTLHAYRTLA